MVQDPSHDYLSPHIQVSFPVTEKTNFRLSYAHMVQAPDFGLVLRYASTDIDGGGVNSRSSFGADLDYGKTIQFEFGARHAFSEDMVLDVAVYNKDNLANPAVKVTFPIDPLNGAPTRTYMAQNTDFGNARGIDVTLQRRIGNYLNGTLGYGFISVKNTGTDPFSYISFFESILGTNTEPPLAALPVSSSRPHTLTGQFNISLPADWKQGTMLGKILHKTGIYTTFRLASGTSYTRCDATDFASQGVRSGGTCGSLPAVFGYNADRLPMYKQFDTRFTREFRLAGFDMTGYLDARNILNLENTTSVWASTGTIQNGAYAQTLWIADSQLVPHLRAAERLAAVQRRPAPADHQGRLRPVQERHHADALRPASTTSSRKSGSAMATGSTPWPSSGPRRTSTGTSTRLRRTIS